MRKTFASVLCFLSLFMPIHAQTKPAPKTMEFEEVKSIIRKAKEKNHWLLIKGQNQYGQFVLKGKVIEIRDKDFLLEDTCVSCWEGAYVRFEQVHSIERRSNLRRLSRNVPTKIGFHLLRYPLGALAEYIGSFHK